jgi:hypothetical protein
VRPKCKEMIVGAESTDARHNPPIDLILPRYNRPHDPTRGRVLRTPILEQWSDRADDRHRQ